MNASTTMPATVQIRRGRLFGLITLVAMVAAVALAMRASAAVPAHLSATAPATQDALARAQAIRTEVTARYRPLSGRKLVVADATVMGGDSFLALWNHDWLDGRIVPVNGGIFFDICSARARCVPTPRAGLPGGWPRSCLAGRRSSSLFAPSWRRP